MNKTTHHKLMTDAEEEIIRQRYPHGGYQACLPELGKYTRHQVNNRAFKLGVTLTPQGRAFVNKHPREYAWKDVDEQAFKLHRQAEELLRAWR